MSPAGKPRQCTHVRLSTTLSSPSRSVQYSTPVSVIAYTSRSLRTSPGILDLEENRTPNLIFNRTERWDEERENGEGVRGGVGRRHRFALQCVWKRLDWALITLRGNEDFVVPIFLSKPSFVRPRHYRDTIVFTGKLGYVFYKTPQCTAVYWWLWSVFFFFLSSKAIFFFSRHCHPRFPRTFKWTVSSTKIKWSKVMI